MEYGILTLLPPIIAIGLALWIKQVIIALLLGVLSGILILTGGNPYLALVALFEDYIFAELASDLNAQTVVTICLIGGFVALIEKSGGAHAFAKQTTRTLTNKFKALVVTWLCGIGIFFTDLGNALILGPIFKPVTDRLRISREKLAYVLDSTSAPVAVLIPITNWGVFIMSILAAEFARIEYPVGDWTGFIQAIPFQLYPILALILVPFVAATQRDFGPMAKAEYRAYSENKLIADDAEQLQPDVVPEIPSGVEAKASNAYVPLIILLAVIFGVLVSFGFPGQEVGGTQVRVALSLGYIMCAIVAGILVVRNKIMNVKSAVDTYFNGLQRMIYVLVILVLAWSIGSVMSNLGTADYVVGVTEGVISPAMLPAIIFVIAGFVAFATGTSWGTFGMLLPIAIPLADAMGVPISPAIGAVLSGALFGDHCSPISDTTILASMASSGDLVDHVKTQTPYALTAAAGAFVGFIVAGNTGNPLLSLVVGIVVMFAVYTVLTYVMGRSIPFVDLNKEVDTSE